MTNRFRKCGVPLSQRGFNPEKHSTCGRSNPPDILRDPSRAQTVTNWQHAFAKAALSRQVRQIESETDLFPPRPKEYN